MKLISAYTADNNDYPAYINIAQDFETVRIIVRSQGSPERSGDISEIYLPLKVFKSLIAECQRHNDNLDVAHVISWGDRGEGRFWQARCCNFTTIGNGGPYPSAEEAKKAAMEGCRKLSEKEN